MSKRKVLTEADVLRLIRRDGRYHINPLAYRNKGRAKLLDRMYKDGRLTRRVFKLDRVEYYEAEPYPMSIDHGKLLALCAKARELQGTHYGDACGLHLDMIDWAKEYDSALAQPANDKSVRLVRFIGINPLEIGAGATEPMLRDSWRFAFSEGDDGVLRFAFNDNGSLVATAATAQPAEAVEAQWITDLRNEAVRGSMKDVYWLSRDQVFELIGDDIGRKAPAYPDVIVARPTDAAQGAVAPMLAIPEHIALYQGPDDCPHLQLNGASVAIFPAGSWAEVCDALDSITGSKVTHPQAAPAQGDGWIPDRIELEQVSRMCRPNSLAYADGWNACRDAMLAAAPSQEPR